MIEIKNKKNIEDFQEYLKSTNKMDFWFELMNNKELAKTIIENNLYWKNIYFILDNFKYDFSLKMFKILYFADQENKFVNEEFVVLLNNKKDLGNEQLFFDILEFINATKKEQVENIYNLIEFIIKNNDFHLNFNIIEFLYNGDYKSIIEDNFYSILNNCYDIYRLKELIKHDEKLLNKLNNFINTNPSKLIYGILVNGFKLDLEVIKGEKIYDTMKTIIDELIINQDINYSDIEFLGKGAYSYAFSIGSKVLKIGKKRETFVIENNKRFLKPVLRTEIDKLDNNGILGCVEVTEKVMTGSINTEEVDYVYVLYKELRDKGYYWVDCAERNLGKLIRKNKVYFDDLDPVKEAINYTTDNNEELEVGEIVMIDNDFIFTEEELKKIETKNPTMYKVYMETIDKYESRYNEEVKKQK